jgi:capsule polysaccharide export protein KpsE/RkpR
MESKANESEGVRVKEPRRLTEISVEQLQELEVNASGNGNEVLIPVPKNVVRGWLLWRNRRFLWRSTLCGIILASCFAFWLRKSYTATARLMPPEKEAMSTSPMAMMAAMSSGNNSGGGSGGGGGGMGDVASVASDLLGTKSQGALVVDMMYGRSVEDAVVNRFDLRKVYKVKFMDDARKRLMKHTDIAEDKKSGIIVMKVADHDPQRAAAMAQTYLEALNDVLATVSTSSARRERIFIEDRLKTVKQSLDAAERQYSDYASQNSAIDIPEQGRAMVAATAMMQGQLIAAQSELEGLAQVYTENNVRVRSARARVAGLQKELDKMGGAENATAPSKNGSSDIYPSIRKLPLLGVRWADLYREVKIEETVYELLTGEYELAKIQEAKEVPSVKFYDPPEVPERPSGPPRLLIIVLGGLFSCGMAAGWVLGNAAWQEIDPRAPHRELAEHVGRETLGPFFESAARVRARVVKCLPNWPGNGHVAVELGKSDEQRPE